MDKKKRREVVQLFLERCVIYANASIERKIKRGDENNNGAVNDPNKIIKKVLMISVIKFW